MKLLARTTEIEFGNERANRWLPVASRRSVPSLPVRPDSSGYSDEEKSPLDQRSAGHCDAGAVWELALFADSSAGPSFPGRIVAILFGGSFRHARAVVRCERKLPAASQRGIIGLKHFRDRDPQRISAMC